MGIFSRGRPSFQEPPADKGLYRVVGPESNIKYIGSANNLSTRIGTQIRTGECRLVTGWAGKRPSQAYQ